MELHTLLVFQEDYCMKRTAKIVFLFLLAIIACLSLVGMYYAQDTGTTEIVLDSVNAFPGEEVVINVTLRDNPGILSAALKLEYDSGLVLTSAENGEAFSGMMMTRTDLASGSKFVWESRSDASMDDGVILEKGTPSDIFDNPQNDRTREFLSKVL